MLLVIGGNGPQGLVEGNQALIKICLIASVWHDLRIFTYKLYENNHITTTSERLELMKKTLFGLIFCLISLPIFGGEDCDVCGPQLTGSPLKTNFSFQAIGQTSKYITQSNDNKNFETTLSNDPRKIFAKSSPKWLEAVGKISVPHRTKNEKTDCSVSLLTDHLDKDSIIAVTAGHCMKNWNFPGQDPKAPAVITFTKKDGTKVTRSVEKILSMSPSEGDYAILKLNKTVPNSLVKPLLIADGPYRGADGFGYLEFDEFTGGPGHKKAFGTLAGYSSDSSPQFGNKGQNLTYHEDCHLNGGEASIKSTKCWSYKGASGGATVVTVDQGDYNDNIGVEHLYVGAVMGQRKGDNKRAFITPLEFFREPLESAFKNYMP